MNILLAVTGSIAAYKAYDICRELTKNKNQVKVILSKGALNFINRDTFRYLGASDVFGPDDDFNTDNYKDFNVLHIELAKWCDRLVICPASCNSIAKISNGLCDDLLSSIFISIDRPVLVFPAMNTKMLEHSITQRNINQLALLPNVYIHTTMKGELACGDIGAGKLESVDKILKLITLLPFKFTNKKVLITAGATIARIDPIRYVTNPSSALTGILIAKYYLSQGYAVTLLCAQANENFLSEIDAFPNLEIIRVQETREAYHIIMSKVHDFDTYISTAAFSDLEFDVSEKKIQKDSQNNFLEYKIAPDILSEVVKKYGDKIKTVGFAAQTHDLLENMRKKLQKKNVNLLIGNLVSNTQDTPQGFQQDSNDYLVIHNGEEVFRGFMSKAQLAQYIFNEIENENL